jgi:urea transport system substrate-binding protein
VGTLNCWAYLQNAPGPRNKKWLADWAAYVKKSGAPYSPTVAIDPMVSTYDSVHMWALAAKKAGSFDVPAVQAAFPGVSFDDPSGYTLKMTAENNYVSRGVFIGSVNDKQGFDLLWQSKDTPTPIPFSKS